MKLVVPYVVDRDSTRRACANRHETEAMRTLHMVPARRLTEPAPSGQPLALEFPVSQLADVELGDILTLTLTDEANGQLTTP